MNFADRLSTAVAERESSLCVGLDPRIEMLPPELITGLRAGRAGRARAYERFCIGVIDAVADQAVAVKPQVAFFEAVGGYGLSALERICAYAREAGLLVIADAKRGDIGSTASAYAEAWLSPVDGEGPIADALTVNPYMGGDSLDPFLVACGDGAGLFVLARTSNPGGADLQETELTSGELLWEHTAALIDKWGAPYIGSCGLSAVGAVVGATHPDAVARARELMPNAVLLLPGVGAQGGSASALLPAVKDNPAGGLVVAARSVIYAFRDRGGDWRQSVRAAAIELRQAVPVAG